jgi:hypothetical protein
MIYYPYLLGQVAAKDKLSRSEGLILLGTNNTSGETMKPLDGKGRTKAPLLAKLSSINI